jgi:hypothetical protein
MTLVDTFDAGRPMPWLFELAADLADEPVDALDTDPGVIARSLSGAVDLFSLPAVTVSFDTTVEADAVGCSVTDAGVEGIVESVDDAFAVDIDTVVDSERVAVRLNATERLADTCEAAVLGGVTGPALLAKHLLAGDDVAAEVHEEAVFTAGEICVELANAYLDAGADGVAVLEPGGVDAPLYREATAPVVNTLDHYNAAGVVVADTLSPADVRTAGAVGFDAVTGAVADSASVLDAAADSDVRLGIGVPSETFREGPEAVATFREELPDSAGCSSQWTVPRDTSPEAVHELMGRP